MGNKLSPLLEELKRKINQDEYKTSIYAKIVDIIVLIFSQPDKHIRAELFECLLRSWPKRNSHTRTMMIVGDEGGGSHIEDFCGNNGSRLGPYCSLFKDDNNIEEIFYLLSDRLTVVQDPEKLSVMLHVLNIHAPYEEKIKRR